MGKYFPTIPSSHLTGTDEKLRSFRKVQSQILQRADPVYWPDLALK